MDDHQETKSKEMLHLSIEEKDLAAVSYIPPISIFLFFFAKGSSFVRFHCKQAMVILVCGIGVWFLPFSRLLSLILLVGSCFGFVAAVQGERKDIPFVGSLSRGDWQGVRRTWSSCVASIRHAVHTRHRKHSSPTSPDTSGT